MTNAKLEEILIANLAAKKEAPAPRSAGMEKVLYTVVGAVVVFLLTGYLKKGDQSSDSIIALSTTVKTLNVAVDELRRDFSRVSEQMQNARVDPFTGTMGINLKDRLETEIDTLADETDDKLRRNKEGHEDDLEAMKKELAELRAEFRNATP